MTNKNSTYVNALVAFLLDTKPFHAKLTEVVEEFRFSDNMVVNLDEQFSINTVMKAAWPYTYFSGGSTEGQSTRIHQIVAPNTSIGVLQFGSSENTDLGLVPLAYDPKSIDGSGIAYAAIKRAVGQEPIIEGHDIHLSHGAYCFQIHQTQSAQLPVAGYFSNTYEVSDGPFPISVTLPFAADSLIIVGQAEQVTLSEILINAPGEVTVHGLSSTLPYAPLFTEKRNELLLSHVTSVVQQQALDVSVPSSAISKVQNILNAIAAQLSLFPNTTASAALADVQAIVSASNLPTTYEELLTALINANTPVIAGYAGWRVDLGNWSAPFEQHVDQALASLSTGLYFNSYTDVGLRENGALRYENVYRNDVQITAITANPIRQDYEEWELEAVTSTTFSIRGTASGVVGSVSVPGSFSLPQISFTIANGPSALVPGTIIKLTPKAKITVHGTAPLEAWTLIKVNPKAFNRPALSSTRYGYLLSGAGVRDFVTILDPVLQTGTIVLTAISQTQFTLTSTSEPLYEANITVNQGFNDGRLAFTIISGSEQSFEIGDKFFIELVNPAPGAADLDLYYGFDMDAYDAENMVYNNVSSSLNDYLNTLDFGWGSRFSSYDTSSFGLQISQNAVAGRQWRLRALRDSSDAQYELRLQNSVPTNQVSSIATQDPTNPNAGTQFDMSSNTSLEGPHSDIDLDPTVDLLLWYANTFSLEYYDESLMTWIGVADVPVNSSFSSAEHGLSFTLVPGAKPFIAAQLNSTQYNTLSSAVSETVFGGDVISWTVINEPAIQTEPAGLVSSNAPHLWLHADSFHNSTPALWTLTWIDVNQYYLQGVFSSGALNGQFVYEAPGLLISTTDGLSYQNDVHGLHWTIYPGSRGQALGDSISFRTLSAAPTFLVHGSVSGWQPDAVIDEWYWNGKIGFKIEAPKAFLFENGVKLDTWTSSSGVFVLQSLRSDTPSAVYTIRSHTPGHWTMYRNGKVVADGASLLRDQYVSIAVPPAIGGTVVLLHIIGDSHDLSIGHDLAIVRTTEGRTLDSGDSLILHRTKFDSLQLSIKPRDSTHNLSLQPLGITTTDLRYVDHNALSGVALTATSPEVAVLQGWVPILEERYDGNSPAFFSDQQSRVQLRAAGTGEAIGTIESFSNNPAEPVLMRWNPAFAAAYLPLNSEATIVTLGSGLNEKANINVTEGILFLLSGGGLSTSAIFIDTAGVGMEENALWDIRSAYFGSTNISLADGPFGGFLPGFDNLPFDFESGGDIDPIEDTDPEGHYDVGLPLVQNFLRAQYLMGQQTISPDEELELNGLLGQIGAYLNGDLSSTTLDFFVSAISASAPINSAVVSNFGIPAVGAGIDVKSDSSNSASTSVTEAMIITTVDSGFTYDLFQYDVGSYDDAPDSAIVMLLNSFSLSAKAATTSTHPLSGLANVDGVSIAIGDVVLIKNQTLQEHNGLYVAGIGAWTRHPAFNTANSLYLGLGVQVLNGVAHGGSVWEVSSPPTTINVSPIIFSRVLTYGALNSALVFAAAGRVVDLSLSFDYIGVPTVWIWMPTTNSSVPVILDKISARLFRFSIPFPTEFKLIAG